MWSSSERPGGRQAQSKPAALSAAPFPWAARLDGEPDAICWQGSQWPGSEKCCQVLGRKGKARRDGIINRREHNRKKKTKTALENYGCENKPQGSLARCTGVHLE